MTVESVGQPIYGTVSNNGTDVTYSPPRNFAGTDVFAYTASDGSALSNAAMVTVTITAVNDTPLANDDAVVIDEDTSVLIHVLYNDWDADYDILLFSDLTQPLTGTATITGTDINYTPTLDFNGVVTLTYVLTDGLALSNAATVTITVDPVNDAPVAVDDSATTDENMAVTVDVLANDSDVDGDGLTVDGVIQPSNGTVTVTNNGTDVTYTPDADFHGATALATPSATATGVRPRPRSV